MIVRRSAIAACGSGMDLAPMGIFFLGAGLLSESVQAGLEAVPPPMGRPSTADAPTASNFGVGKSPGHISDPATLDEKVWRLNRAIFAESPQCWGSAKSHDRVIVPTGIGAAGSRPKKNRPGFGKRKVKPPPRAHAWQPSAADSAGSPILGRWAMDRLNATIDAINAFTGYRCASTRSIPCHPSDRRR